MKKIINVPFELDEFQAFSMLCEILDISNVVYSEEQLYIHDGDVCKKDKDGNYEFVDERADLFAALRNVVNVICPNVEFRSDDYITHYDDEEEDEDDEDNKAEWIFKEVRGQMTNVCSNCGGVAVYDTYFCPNCGKEMLNGH